MTRKKSGRHSPVSNATTKVALSKGINSATANARSVSKKKENSTTRVLLSIILAATFVVVAATCSSSTSAAVTNSLKSTKDHHNYFCQHVNTTHRAAARAFLQCNRKLRNVNGRRLKELNADVEAAVEYLACTLAAGSEVDHAKIGAHLENGTMHSVDIDDFAAKFKIHEQFDHHGDMPGCYMQGHTIKLQKKLDEYLNVVKTKYGHLGWGKKYEEVSLTCIFTHSCL